MTVQEFKIMLDKYPSTMEIWSDDGFNAFPANIKTEIIEIYKVRYQDETPEWEFYKPSSSDSELLDTKMALFISI